jgi:hypothetical protein
VVLINILELVDHEGVPGGTLRTGGPLIMTGQWAPDFSLRDAGIRHFGF